MDITLMAYSRIKAAGLKGKPVWLKKRVRPGKARNVEKCIDVCGLNTVCTEAACPNRNECFAKGTAAFMILGNVCTRNCRFCNVFSGSPAPPDGSEPKRLAEAVRKMGLVYTVVTSVTRDDLPDGGSGIYAEVISAVRRSTGSRVEVLTPDFRANSEDIQTVIQACPDVYNHNVETVPRLYPDIRPGADYQRSLDLIRHVSGAGLTAKSGIMVGLGETDSEIIGVFRDLLDAGCTLLTIGQYLCPGQQCVPVYEYIHPDHFEYLKKKALSIGFKGVSSGPFVRSSHNAGDLFNAAVCETT